MSDFNETWIFSTSFVKYSNIEFHENPSLHFRFVPYGRTDTTKPIVAFRNFATGLDVHNARSTLDWPWAILPFTVTVCWNVTVAFIQVTIHEIFALCYVPVRRSVFRDISGQLSTIFKGQASSWSGRPLGQMGCPETSVTTNIRHLNPRRTMTSITRWRRVVLYHHHHHH